MARRKPGRCGGFTILDALFGAGTVAAALVVVGVSTPAAMRDATHKAQFEGNMRRISQMYTMYMADHEGRFPLNGDYQNYPEYQPLAGGGGGVPPYMNRHPDAILEGPHAGPWNYTDKLAVYDPDPSVWISQAWLEIGQAFTADKFKTSEPYHPTVHTHYTQSWGVADNHTSYTMETLRGRPSDTFVVTHGSGAMLGGSGIFDNAHTLRPSTAKNAFIFDTATVQDTAMQDGTRRVTGLGKIGVLFADGHTDFLRFWDVLEGSRGESAPGARDGKYYLDLPDRSSIGWPKRE